MEQLREFSDQRLIQGCIHCEREAETRDHVPSRALLEPPYPENLPVIGACRDCNNGFSRDEEYFVCLIESALMGSTDPDQIGRPSVAKIMRRAPSLRARIEAAKSCVDSRFQFAVEPERIRNVLIKLARGHAAFELSQACREEPSQLWWTPLATMSDEHREDFDACEVVGPLGEVGSRNVQRMMVITTTLRSADGSDHRVDGLVINDWVDVQEDHYRYLAIDAGNEIRIKMIIREYLACEVVWQR